MSYGAITGIEQQDNQNENGGAYAYWISRGALLFAFGGAFMLFFGYLYLDSDEGVADKLLVAGTASVIAAASCVCSLDCSCRSSGADNAGERRGLLRDYPQEAAAGAGGLDHAHVPGVRYALTSPSASPSSELSESPAGQDSTINGSRTSSSASRSSSGLEAAAIFAASPLDGDVEMARRGSDAKEHAL